MAGERGRAIKKPASSARRPAFSGDAGAIRPTPRDDSFFYLERRYAPKHARITNRINRVRVDYKLFLKGRNEILTDFLRDLNIFLGGGENGAAVRKAGNAALGRLRRGPITGRPVAKTDGRMQLGACGPVMGMRVSDDFEKQMAVGLGGVAGGGGAGRAGGERAGGAWR